VDQGGTATGDSDAANQAVKLVDRALDGRRAQLDQIRLESQRVVGRLKRLLDVKDDELQVQVNVKHNEPFTVTRTPPPDQASARSGRSRTREWSVAGIEAADPGRLGLARDDRDRSGDKTQLALWSDASPTSSSYTNNLGALRTAGLIVYPSGGTVTLTEAGSARAAIPDHPPTIEEVHQALLRRLSRPQVKIMEALIAAYPEPIAKEDLAEKAEASATSSSYTNNLGTLRSLGVIDYPERGSVVALPVLFLESV
jgi:hypothetical protein